MKKKNRNIQGYVYKLLFVLVLSIVFLETGLRMTGLLIVLQQEKLSIYRQTRAKEFSILTLGESTTADTFTPSWPALLEKEMESSYGESIVRVINKGVSSFTSFHLLMHLDEQLLMYQPDVVITMIGVNDFDSTPYNELYKPKVYSQDSTSLMMVLKNMRLYRVVRLFYLQSKRYVSLVFHHLYQSETLIQKGLLYEERGEEDIAEQYFLAAYKKDPSGIDALYYLGRLYFKTRNFDNAELFLTKATDTENPYKEALQLLSRLYLDMNDTSAAEEYLSYLRLNYPEDVEVAVLYSSYLIQVDSKQSAIDFLDQFAAEIEEHAEIYLQLAALYLDLGYVQKAEDALFEALVLDVRNDHVVDILDDYYLTYDDAQALEQLYLRALEVAPTSWKIGTKLADFYSEYNQLNATRSVLEDLHTHHPNTEAVTLRLVRVYRELEMVDEAERLLSEYLDQSPLYRNYLTIRDKVLNSGAKLVVMQYPLRSVEPLRMLFADDHESVFFVDNERLFEELVKEDGYDVYFTDRFAGDFGHLTEKGNEILAKNAASVLSEVWNFQ